MVVVLNSNGKDTKRINILKNILKNSSNCLAVELAENELPEIISPITLIASSNWLMNYMADGLNVGDTFTVGGKVTRVENSVK